MRFFRRFAVLRAYSIRAVAASITILALSLLILSPLALRALSSFQSLNWLRLSYVAQTYGAVSVLFSAIALVGVVFSLIYQSRSLKIARVQAQRSFHFDLLKMEMENPVYMEATGAPWGLPVAFDYDWLRKRQYVHMWFSYWESRFLLREMQESEIRNSMHEIFCGISAREYWATARGIRPRVYSKGLELRFTEIVDAEYQISLTTPALPEITSSNSERRSVNKNQHGVTKSCATVVAITLAATGIGIMLGRHMTGRGRSRQTVQSG
jgi:hypothetical protein